MSEHDDKVSAAAVKGHNDGQSNNYDPPHYSQLPSAIESLFDSDKDTEVKVSYDDHFKQGKANSG